MRTRNAMCLLLLLGLSFTAVADQMVLHDNGLAPDGLTGSPVSSPMVPHVVSAEDFTVPEGDVWTVTGLRFVLAPTLGMEEGPVLGVRICTDSGGEGPLSPIYHATLPYERTYVGEYFGVAAYEYTVGGFELELGPGVYWTSPAFPRASHRGYANWLTTRVDDVRRQGDLGWWSPDAMDTWFRMDELGWEGDYWHHAFQVLGRRDGPPIPERTNGESDDRRDDASALDAEPPRRLKPAARAEVGDHREGALPVTSGDLLWDNNIVPSGVMARAISPPNFPDIRVADDFFVPREGWLIRSAHLNVIEDAGWTHGGEITVFIFEDTGNGPGEIIFEATLPFIRMATGDQYFGRDGYDYWVEELDHEIPQGSYWMGFRNGGGGGAGTNYWQISDAGPDGIDSDTGWFSLDAGATWTPEGATWHHAFEIRGEGGAVSISLPHRFEVTRGVRVSGGLVSLSTSDDDYLIVEARRPSAVSQPSVQVVVDGDAVGDSLFRIDFTVEASTTFEGLVQWIDFYDFDADRWERMDTREGTVNDSIVVVSVNEDADRFREAETGTLRARVSFWDPGLPIAGWFGRIDQTMWEVLQR